MTERCMRLRTQAVQPQQRQSASHDSVRGPPTALRHGPPDILQRVLDVAGLAVQAVLRVDLQPLAAVLVWHVLVHAWRGARPS